MLSLRPLARFTAWLSRKANFRYTVVAERSDGVWEEMFRIPRWMLPMAGEPFYPYGYADTDVRAVYLDQTKMRLSPRWAGRKVVLVDTRPDLPRPRSWDERTGRDEA